MATILVVEDNTANMTLAVFLLKTEGHMILSATNAEAGLTLARTEHPDLIPMHIQLAGCDGYIAKPMRCKDFLAAIALRVDRP